MIFRYMKSHNYNGNKNMRAGGSCDRNATDGLVPGSSIYIQADMMIRCCQQAARRPVGNSKNDYGAV